MGLLQLGPLLGQPVHLRPKGLDLSFQIPIGPRESPLDLLQGLPLLLVLVLPQLLLRGYALYLRLRLILQVRPVQLYSAR
jgi:hypothetical protein